MYVTFVIRPWSTKAENPSPLENVKLNKLKKNLNSVLKKKVIIVSYLLYQPMI